MKSYIQLLAVTCFLASSVGMHRALTISRGVPEEIKKTAEDREVICKKALEGLRQALAMPAGVQKDINARLSFESVISEYVNTLDRMQYLDAIPVFVEHIDFTLSISEEVGSEKIMVVALSHFGFSCVPAVVNAYVAVPQDKESKRKQEYLLIVLTDARVIRSARTYAKGLLQETKDAEPRKRLQALIKQLDEWIAVDEKKQPLPATHKP